MIGALLVGVKSGFAGLRSVFNCGNQAVKEESTASTNIGDDNEG